MSDGPSIFIMVDMEGISGICTGPQVQRIETPYRDGQRYMTWDANACVAGCFDAGASRVVVRDVHSNGFNMLWHEFDPRAEYIQGLTDKHRIPEIETFDGLILLGYHGMAGKPQAVLEHTMSGANWQNFYMNGVRSGEVAIDAGIAGDHGVPTIMVSGDDKVCAEAREFLPGVETVQVKKGMGRGGAWMLPKEKAHELIRKGAANAVRRRGEIKPYQVAKPVTMRLELVSRGAVPMKRPHVTVVDGRTYEVTADTVEEALNSL